MPLQKVKDFILHDLDEISEKIKEKIELIQNSNIDYKSFEKFKFALGQLDNFSIRSEISDQMQQKQINNFLNTFIPNLDEIIEKNSLNNPDNIYLSLLTELNKFKDNEQNIDEKDCEKFAKRANKFLDICTDEEQKNTINEALQIIKSQTLSNQNLNKNNLSDFEKEIIRLMENGIKSDNLIDELAKNRNLREGSDRYDTLYDKVCDTLFDLEEKGILNHNLNPDYFTLKTENFNKRKMR